MTLLTRKGNSELPLLLQTFQSAHRFQDTFMYGVKDLVRVVMIFVLSSASFIWPVLGPRELRALCPVPQCFPKTWQSTICDSFCKECYHRTAPSGKRLPWLDKVCLRIYWHGFQDNTRYAFLQLDDRVLVYRGVDQPDMSVINPESDVWQHIKVGLSS